MTVRSWFPGKHSKSPMMTQLAVFTSGTGSIYKSMGLRRTVPPLAGEDRMRIVTRYILRELLGPFFFGLFLSFGRILIGNIFVNLTLAH